MRSHRGTAVIACDWTETARNVSNVRGMKTTACPWARSVSSFGHKRVPAMTAALKEPRAEAADNLIGAGLSAEWTSGFAMLCTNSARQGRTLGVQSPSSTPTGRSSVSSVGNMTRTTCLDSCISGCKTQPQIRPRLLTEAYSLARSA